MISDPCTTAMRIRLFWQPYEVVISNKKNIKPDAWTDDLNYTIRGWSGASQSPSDTGYNFKKFWGNCHALLGDISKLEGIQQLCHQYYLQNGQLNAINVVKSIKRFLGFTNDQ